MKTLIAILTASLLTIGFADALQAQETNAPKTKLDTFEASVDVVIVRASLEVGSVDTREGTVSVWCRESVDANSGRKMHGLAVTLTARQVSDATILDYDELDSLLKGLSFLSRANGSISTLPNFDAVLMSRDGLQAAAYTSQKQPGMLGASLKSNRSRFIRISLQPQEFAQFYSLIQQGKTKLDALRGG